MNPKYLLLYIITATFVSGLAVYQVVTTYPAVYYPKVVIYVIISIFFFYLAYKTYHEKKDDELM